MDVADVDGLPVPVLDCVGVGVDVLDGVLGADGSSDAPVDLVGDAEPGVLDGVAVPVAVPDGDAVPVPDPVRVPDGVIVAAPLSVGVSVPVPVGVPDGVDVIDGDAPTERVPVSDAVREAVAVVVGLCDGDGVVSGELVSDSVPVVDGVGVCVPD